ncbi:nitrogen assimilation transcription factor nirA [Ceratobasidium sp. AG-Ba]|nr:nitrogen assimilation transcription factor nirA [Ceratobasidium sp. AG-Ba]QRW04169.1 nitrogen assimilation transcription factor nirA [Ceratobasidium sp. AG-Ba]
MECDLRSKSYFALDLPRIDWEIDGWPDSAPTSQSLGSRLTQVFTESCKLALVAESIFNLHRSLAAFPFGEDNRAIEINWRLDAWLSELPTELLVLDDTSLPLLPHVIMLNVSYWWLVLRLHEPYYRPAPNANTPLVNTLRPFGDLSDTFCDRAASRIVFLVNLYDQLHGLRFFPRCMIQAIQAAGAVFIRQQAAAAVQNHNQDGIHKCIASLRTITNTWPCANNYSNFLENLLQVQASQLSTPS